MLYKVLLALLLLIKAAAYSNNGFTFNGNWKVGGVAEVTSGGLFKLSDQKVSSGVGHIFYSLPMDVKNSSNGNALSFSTTFIFGIVPGIPNLVGHGTSFVLSPSKEMPGALPAQYLGLFNRTNNGDPSNHIVAVEFDLFQNEEFGDINHNHVGIDINSLNSVISAPAGYFSDENREFKNLTLASGEELQAWVDYDGIQKQLNVTLSPLYTNKPNIPLLSLDFDISSVLLDQMYVGFSSSTGRLAVSSYILGWSFQLNGKAAELDLSQLPSLPRTKRSKNKETIMVIGLSLVGVILGLIIVSGLLYLVRRKAKLAETLEDWELQYGPHRFSYKDLYMATKGFKEEELLGRGGFGQVYRGALPVSNIQVAVKKILGKSGQGMKEFIAEIATIGRLRHPNLVRLLGYCRREDELLLVYDYMPNASLDKFLFNKPECVLNWDQRLKVIQDVASGLTYLHEEWVEAIIHRDIKASNVLLDSEFNAKLGDFGLARFSAHGQDPETTHVAGTLGYIAPELARNGKATSSTDVFAFGAFCLEVACGRRPVEHRASPQEVILVDWVLECWKKGDILRTVDPRLNNQFKVEEIELLLKLGLLCSHSVAAQRPRMSQVLHYLRGDAPLPQNLDALLQAQDREGGLYDEVDHSVLCQSQSRPSLTITESFIHGGR